MPGAALTWVAVGRGASVVAAAKTSDASGSATAQWVLGTDAAEGQRLLVTVTTLGQERQLALSGRAVPYIVSQLRLAVDTSAELRLGDTLALQVDAVDPYGNIFPAPGLSVSTADSSVATAIDAAVVGGPRRGLSRVRLSSQGQVVDFPLHVTQYVAAITPSADTIRLTSLGADAPVSYVVTDDRGRIVRDTAATLVVEDTGLVELEGGLVRGRQVGATGVQLSLGTATAHLTVQVRQRVASLGLIRDTVRFDALFDTTTVHPVAKDSLGFDIPDPAVIVSVTDTTIARLVGPRTLQAVMPGLAMATVQDVETGLLAARPLEVEQSVASVEVGTTLLFDALGDTATVFATAYDRLGSRVHGTAMSYSVSDTTVAVVGPGSTVRTVAPGQTTLYAVEQGSGIVGSAPLVVTQRVASVSVGPDGVVFDAVGDTAPLWVSAWDRLGSAVAAASYTYSSSDTSVAVIGIGGAVASRGNGTTFIVAQSADGPADTTMITVTQRVTHVVPARDSALFESLQAVQALNGRPVDRLGVPVPGGLAQYAIADTSVATVDAAGRVAAVANGATRLYSIAGADTATTEILVRQRAVRVQSVQDTLWFTSLGDTAQLEAIALDSLGWPVPGTVRIVGISDSSVAQAIGDDEVRSAGNGITATHFEIGGIAGSTAVSVRQVAARLSLVGLPSDSIARPGLNDLVDIGCVAEDSNGYPIPMSLIGTTSAGGGVTGTSCDDLRATRSGVDTVTASANGLTAQTVLRLAIRPVVASQIGSQVTVDGVPAGDPWAPSATIAPDGQIELYFGNYQFDSTTGINRSSLTRLVSSDGSHFTFDRVVLRYGDSINAEDGRGIENAVIFPDAGGTSWRMIYAGGNQVSGWQAFGAVSSDRLTWTKTGVVVANGYPAPVRPVGEGMVVDRLSDGTWRMVMSAFEPAPSTFGSWQITEWRSSDQQQWTYLRTLISSGDMPLEGRCAVYSPVVQQIGPSMWRIIFAAHSYCGTQKTAAIYSAVSSDFAHWQLEGKLLGQPGADLFYATIARDRVYFVRRQAGLADVLAEVQIQMP